MLISITQKLHGGPDLAFSGSGDHLPYHQVPPGLPTQGSLQVHPPILLGHLSENSPLQQHHREPVSPVPGEEVAGQMLVDEGRPLLSGVVGEKGPHLLSGGDGAGEIQSQPAQELCIVAAFCQGSAGLCGDELVKRRRKRVSVAGKNSQRKAGQRAEE